MLQSKLNIPLSLPYLDGFLFGLIYPYSFTIDSLRVESPLNNLSLSFSSKWLANGDRKMLFSLS